MQSQESGHPTKSKKVARVCLLHNASLLTYFGLVEAIWRFLENFHGTVQEVDGFQGDLKPIPLRPHSWTFSHDPAHTFLHKYGQRMSVSSSSKWTCREPFAHLHREWLQRSSACALHHLSPWPPQAWRLRAIFAIADVPIERVFLFLFVRQTRTWAF